MNENQSKTLEIHDELLLGRNGNPGIVHKVGFMWRIHIWLLTLIGAGAGFLFKCLIDFIGKAGIVHP